MREPREHDVTAPDGRNLRVREFGAGDGPVVVVHHGTPAAGLPLPSEQEGAVGLGARLVAYDRPGYGGSDAQPGRTVADAAADVEAVLDALGVDRFATYGVSGGGPHALACAALLARRCAAAATLAGVGPFDAPDLDWLAGMGEGNQKEYAVAREGREALVALCREEAEQILAVEPQQLADEMRPHLSAVDAALMSGELAAFYLESFKVSLGRGVQGWVDDDLAFLAPWGFDPGAIEVPVLVWQGVQDLMVPASHGEWLGAHVNGAEARIDPGEGHLTLHVQHARDVLRWLLDKLS